MVSSFSNGRLKEAVENDKSAKVGWNKHDKTVTKEEAQAVLKHRGRR